LLCFETTFDERGEVLRRDFCLAALAQVAANQPPRMRWGDTSRLGRPFSKDPPVVRSRGRHLLYSSIPAAAGDPAEKTWATGIAESTDPINWAKPGEMLPERTCEARDTCAPCAKIIEGKVHLFYQTCGGGREDAICHAASTDGVRFVRETANPVFRPAGPWNADRAIDAEVAKYRG
jgi:hypothetical protein